MEPEINKSSRHSKITGDFAEHLVLYWLSKYGFESARLDHTGIDLIANNPHTKEVMGISVKSRSKNPGKEKTSLRISSDDLEKASQACVAFHCIPYFAIVADLKGEIFVFILTLERLRGLYPTKGKNISWAMTEKRVSSYLNDPEIKIFKLSSEIRHWWQ